MGNGAWISDDLRPRARACESKWDEVRYHPGTIDTHLVSYGLLGRSLSKKFIFVIVVRWAA